MEGMHGKRNTFGSQRSMFTVLKRIEGRWREKVARLSRNGTPCERLYATMLLDVVRVVTRPSKRDEWSEAVAWVRGPAEDEAMPFAMVCDVLEVPEDEVRADILRGTLH